MLIRAFWQAGSINRKEWEPRLEDAFWVEATGEEAERCVFPRIEPAAREKSKDLAKKGRGIAASLGTPARPFCFLVTRDLNSIRTFWVHYPFANLWNGYSPFREMPETFITSLDEVRSLELPPGEEPCPT